MPYDNVPKALWPKMDRCVADVQKTGKSKESAIAICYAQIVGKESWRPITESAPATMSDGGLDGVVLVEGLSANRIRYSRAVLEQAIPVFAGALIYADHNLPHEPPERSIRNVVGRLPGPEGFSVETLPDGRACLRFRGGIISEAAAWLKTMLREGILGDMSINAAGKGYQEREEFVVTEFAPEYPASLDFVTRAAAGGYGTLRESATSKLEVEMELGENERLRAALLQARREAREYRAAALLAEKTRGLSEAARAKVAQAVAPAVKRFVEQGEMPAVVDVTLPDDVQALPEEAQAEWLAAYLEAKVQKGEMLAVHIAWAEIAKSWEQDEAGEWKRVGATPEEELSGEIEQAVADAEPAQESRRMPGRIVGQGYVPVQRVTEADLETFFKQKFGGRNG